MTAAKIEHALMLTRTNAAGVMPLCRCGWSGDVERAPYRQAPRARTSVRHWDWAEEAARAQYVAHVRREGPLTVQYDPRDFAHIFIKTGRFGRA